MWEPDGWRKAPALCLLFSGLWPVFKISLFEIGQRPEDNRHKAGALRHRASGYHKMLTITTENIGKKYRREWIFRRVNLTLNAGTSYTFVGPNGSGKSTLLQLLAGNLPATEGTLTYSMGDKLIDPDNWFRQVSIAAPYLELVEELTLDELLTFHQTFKPFRNGLTSEAVADRLLLTHARNKEIKYFSSGMKQRVKLGLAFFSNSPIVILDEPTVKPRPAGRCLVS